MKNSLLLFACLLSSFFSIAQINYGGEPLSWSKNVDAPMSLQSFSPLDKEKLNAEDEVNDKDKSNAYRFGKDHIVDIDFFKTAIKTVYKNTDIYKMGIYCSDAISISMLLDEFYIPEGGALYVYNQDQSELKGAFTSKSNKTSGVFPIGIVKGEYIILEYNGSAEDAIIHIGEVTHGYRDVMHARDLSRGPFGDADPCHVNVNCEEGASWQDQKRSVVLIIEGGESHCSGAIVNNTAQDETPYLLTANHCLGDPADWVFYFNHESPGCVGNTGPVDQSIAGGTLIANRSLSDFALIELSEDIPSEYNVYFAGWENSDEENASIGIGIHHPRSDVKKISFENDAPEKVITSQNTRAWEITQWENGSTEGGSSGSPLFDQNGRIIGQLSGGNANCDGDVPNGYSDFYGRIGFSWDGPSATSRLSDWLDPGNTGTVILDGFGPNDVVYSHNVINIQIANVPKVLCNEDAFIPNFTFRNSGTTDVTSATIQLNYNGIQQPDINWTGSVAQNEIETIDLPSYTPSPDRVDMEVVITEINGVPDEYPEDNAFVYSHERNNRIIVNGDIDVIIMTDNQGWTTGWRFRDATGEELQAGGLFSSFSSNTLYTDVLNFSDDGCYEFELFDNAGNGMTSSGFYRLEDEEGNILVEGGGNFGGKDITIFEKLTLSNIEETIDLSNLVDVFPNPTTGLLNIRFKSMMDQVVGIKLINILGQELKKDQMNGELSRSFNIDDLAGGTYFLELMIDGKRGFQKIILTR